MQDKSGVDSKARAAATIALMRSFTPLNIEDGAKLAGCSQEELSNALPGEMGTSMAEAVLSGTLFEGNVGELISGLMLVVHQATATIAALTGDVDRAEVEAVITTTLQYLESPVDSVGEVLAAKNRDAAIAAVNDTVLRRNNKLFVAFVDDDLGWAVNLAATLFASDDEEDEEDEDDCDCEECEDDDSDTETVIAKRNLHG